jgi:hypothetical protein
MVEVQCRMSTLVSLTVSGSRISKTAEISDLQVSRSAKDEGRLRIEALLQNESEIHVFAAGRVTLKTAEGRRLREYPLGQGRGMVLPEGQLRFISLVSLPLAPGDYVAEARLDYEGERGPATASVPFTISREELASLGVSRGVAFQITPNFQGANLTPGALRALDFTIDNLEPQPIEVTVKVRNVAFDPQGGLEVLQDSGGPYSASAWIELPVTEMEIPAEGRRRIRGSLRVPRETTHAGGTAALVFEATTNPTSGEARRSELPALIIAAVPEFAEREASLEDMTVAYDPATQETLLDFTLQNTGNIFLYPTSGNVEIARVLEPEAEVLEGGIQVVTPENERTEPVAELNFESLAAYVLPEGKHAFTAVHAGELPPGRYRVEAEIDYGGEVPALLTQYFVVEPGSQIPAGAEETAREETSS